MKASIDELYTLARQARNENDRVGAETYYEAILLKDPEGWEAPFYLAYYQLANSSINGLETNCQNYIISLSNVFEAAKTKSPDTDSFIAIAKEIKERTVFLTENIVKDAYNDYPALATSDELKDRIYHGITVNLIAAEALDIYFPNGELSVEAAEIRKNAIRYNADLAIKLDYGATSIANGTYASVFGSVIEKVKAVEPSYVPPTLEKASSSYSSSSAPVNSSSDSSSSGGCYVATAVYDSYDCPEVWTLRRFRDNTLAETWYGRAFVRVYYAVSPTLVKWFGSSKFFKDTCRRPLNKLVCKLWSQGVEDTPYEDKQW